MSDYWHELASMTIAAAAAEAGGVIQSTSRMIDQWPPTGMQVKRRCSIKIPFLYALRAT